ncbi:sensor histidine kinase [Desertivirga brevis]|uniref:sensor histidine kinase n=1 Tax=Desertivirga brevis TaxID=2810310 RepID=UPI001A96B30E|nr:hybrid sensor histidine kinase/response regulator [Pedobacter sp. SYSU D00873]
MMNKGLADQEDIEMKPEVLVRNITEKKDKPFRILLVDDRAENLLLLEDALEKEKRNFLTARSGVEALKLALSEDIGLILLDVQMPQMDGYEVAKLLRSNPKTKAIPIIFVTANHTTRKDVLEGFSSGAVDYLVKPLDVTITRAKVDVFEKLYFQTQQLKESLLEKEILNEKLRKYTKVIAHDLKTPLAGIISLVSIMKLNPKIQDVEDLLEEMELLETVSSDLSAMISSLLEDARREHDGPEVLEEVDVLALLKAVLNLLQPPASISIILEGGFPTINTRKMPLQQIFQNLIGNALKYSDKDKGIIRIGVSDVGSHYEFYIKDNGPGINQDFIPLIFEEFTKGENRSSLDSSTGLGLNLVKKLVEEQKGRIWVESKENEGSSFYFTWKKL